MSQTDPNLAAKLQRAPTYQKALAGQWWAPGLPQTPGFRVQNLRAAAQADGVEIPSGYNYDEGRQSFTDANQDRWYTDPRVLGPIAVGVTGGLGAAFGGPAAGAAGASGAAASGGAASTPAGVLPSAAAIPTSVAMRSVPQIASQNVSQNIPLGGITSPGGGGPDGRDGTTPMSLPDEVKKWLTPENLAKLGLTTLAAVNAAKTPNPLDDPRIQQLLEMGIKRQQRVDPLHESVTRLATAMLPTAYQGGGQ